jgi:hypothetical protein
LGLLVQLPFTWPTYKGRRQPPTIRAVTITDSQGRGSVLRRAFEVQRHTSHIPLGLVIQMALVDQKVGPTDALSARPSAE